jgi:hypothetical protein
MAEAAHRWSRWRWRIVASVIALLVAVAIYVGYSRFFGAGLGELCDTATDCSWSGLGHRVCLHAHWGYCTKPCATAADCPATWRCDPGNSQGPICLRPRR